MGSMGGGVKRVVGVRVWWGSRDGGLHLALHR